MEILGKGQKNAEGEAKYDCNLTIHNFLLSYVLTTSESTK